MKNLIDELTQKQRDMLKMSRSVLVVLGVLQIILGMLALGSPWFFAKAITEIIAILFLITGVMQLFQVFYSHFYDKKKALIDILIAVLYVVAGIFIIKNPAAAVITLTAILGWFFLIKGVISLIVAIRSQVNRVWLYFNAIIALVLGIMILSDVAEGAPWILGIFVGINLVISGWTAFMFGLSIPKD